MKCIKCERELSDYQFFNPRNHYYREFFSSGTPNGKVCFECAGDYECIRCHVVKPASEFRVQGRMCKSCKAKVKTPAKRRALKNLSQKYARKETIKAQQ